MSEITVYNPEKEKVGGIPFDPGKVNRPLIHQVVVAQLTNKRHGTSKVKSRHEVSGSTRKIYRQKGTGRARHGDIKAPLFVGGGQAFGPRPRNYEVRLPQKIRRAALRAAVLDRNAEGKLWVLDGLDFPEPKTKLAAAVFSKFGIGNALVVLDGPSPATEKSIRNLARFEVCRIEGLDVVRIMKHEHLVMTRRAFEKAGLS